MPNVQTANAESNTAQDAIQTQLLSLLGELTDKLNPAPAPKPETVPPFKLYIAPLYEKRKALNDALEEVRRAANDLDTETQNIVSQIPAASNERVWKDIFSNTATMLRDMVTTCGWQAKTIERHADHMGHLLVMAADGDTDFLNALEERAAEHE